LERQAEHLEFDYRNIGKKFHNAMLKLRSTSRSLASEQSKSAVTDHAITLNHVMDWDQAKVVDRESNRMDRWIKEAMHTRKEQDNSMNRDEGSYQLSHIYDRLFAATSGGERKLSRPFRFRRRQQPLPKVSGHNPPDITP